MFVSQICTTALLLYTTFAISRRAATHSMVWAKVNTNLVEINEYQLLEVYTLLRMYVSIRIKSLSPGIAT